MFKYYSDNVIPIILTRFKVNKVVLCGINDEDITNQILKFCDTENASYIAIDSEIDKLDPVDEFPLDALHNIADYGAIFIDDDPNWYTVYNELNLIKKNNDEFPLVFICNDIFPHKNRDSYSDPDMIPNEFLNEYSNKFSYNGIQLMDDYYHAIEENTPKNGVSTAIEDFLSENPSIGLMDIKLSPGIVILYPVNNISKIRLGILSEEIEEYYLESFDYMDNILENQILTNHISTFNMLNEDSQILQKFKLDAEKNKRIISEYQNKVKIHSDELNYINSQIDNIGSKLSLKDAQIKNVSSKLVNSENQIANLNNKLQQAETEIILLNNELNKKEQELLNNEEKLNNSRSQISSLENDLEKANDKIDDNLIQLKYKNNDLVQKDNLINIKQRELDEQISTLKFLKKQYDNQLFKLDNKEYCISCYKEVISNNDLEIQYLKGKNLTSKILSPFAYIYLILKSKPNELSLNLKLYRALKNSKCFDIGYYLNYNEDIRESKWCKYFSPELHYVCKGFDEKRKFNKKYFNRNSKSELLDYILRCS